MTCSDLNRVLASSLQALERAGLRRVLRPMGPRRDGVVMLNGRAVVDCSSNDYLGLASDPRLLEAARTQLGGRELGVGAARLISGNREEHGRLEQALATFKGTEDALLFGSGYLANVGVVPALVAQGDGIYADSLNHASLIDGCRLSRGTVEVYAHRDLEDLERRLAGSAHRYRHRWIVTDGVFSMDGDLAPLPDLVDLAARFDAWLYVDDAHATGVLGKTGGGSSEHWGLAAPPEITMGTLGKALGTTGAFVAASATVIEFLRHRARTFVFTTGTPTCLSAAASVALTILHTDPALLGRLRSNVAIARGALRSKGIDVGGDAATPILPIVLGSSARTSQVGEALLQSGYLVGTIRPPTVPPNTARLRITVSAVHDPRQLTGLADVLSVALGKAS